MTESNFHNRPSPRREKAARRAFILWLAAYAIALVAVVALHGIGSAPTGIAAEPTVSSTRQARIIGEPQSLLADEPAPTVVTMKVDG